MPCYHPIRAMWNRESGEVAFWEKASGEAIRLPCGQCVGCRLERARQWAVRCMHEAQLHDRNVFATLTYSSQALESPSLVYRDFQLFMKRLRQRRRRCGLSAPRFYMCGEYGERYQRPHFHVCLFNCHFPDAKHLRGKGDLEEFTSVELEELWGKGSCCLGQVTFESAAYVARYMIVDTQRFHIDEDGVFTELTREFNRMSLRPGIGQGWLDRYGSTDVFPSGAVVVGGREQKAPRFYDRKHELHDPVSFARVRDARRLKAIEQPIRERTWRLGAKETVARAALALKHRS